MERPEKPVLAGCEVILQFNKKAKKKQPNIVFPGTAVFGTKRRMECAVDFILAKGAICEDDPYAIAYERTEFADAELDQRLFLSHMREVTDIKEMHIEVYGRFTSLVTGVKRLALHIRGLEKVPEDTLYFKFREASPGHVVCTATERLLEGCPLILHK